MKRARSLQGVWNNGLVFLASLSGGKEDGYAAGLGEKARCYDLFQSLYFPLLKLTRGYVIMGQLSFQELGGLTKTVLNPASLDQTYVCIAGGSPLTPSLVSVSDLIENVSSGGVDPYTAVNATAAETVVLGTMPYHLEMTLQQASTALVFDLSGLDSWGVPQVRYLTLVQGSGGNAVTDDGSLVDLGGLSTTQGDKRTYRLTVLPLAGTDHVLLADVVKDW